jgi:uncharacterized protein YjbI with pentapeptide repeats
MDQWPAFASMEELRDASDALLERHQESSPSEDQRARRVWEFVRRASATGAQLDSASDRREAQSLIDYWISNSYSLGHSDAADAERPTLSRIGNQLARFKREFARTAAAAGDAYIERIKAIRPTRLLDWLSLIFARIFGGTRLDIIKRLLLRLVRLPESEGQASSAPSRMERLQELDDKEVVGKCVRDLQEIDILTVSGEGTEAVVALKYESLITEWKWFRDLIDQRMLFRQAAVRWARSDPRLFSLREWLRVRKFRKYGSLNEIEQVYASETADTAIRKIMTASSFFIVYGVSILVVFALSSLLSVTQFYKDIFVTDRRVQIALKAIRGEHQSPNVSGNLRWLAANNVKLEIPGVRLKSLDLANIVAPGSNFNTAALDDVQFVKANLEAASFRYAHLDSVTFDHARLTTAGFDGAIIKKTSFADAMLVRATFDGAKFCDGVDFSNADVRSASFKSLILAGNELPNFSGVAWWLIDGWSFEQRAELGKKQTDNDLFSFQRGLNDRVRLDRIPALKAALDQAEQNLATYKDTRNQALWLADKAWTLAIYGVDSPKTEPGGLGDETADLDGVAAASKVIDLIKETPGPGSQRIQAAALDTLGYIRLQRAVHTSANARTSLLEHARGAFEEAIRLSDDGGIFYRYAVALDALGRSDEALKDLEFAVRERSYTPTHEQFLLKQLFSRAFYDKMQQLLGPAPSGKSMPRSPQADSQLNLCK